MGSHGNDDFKALAWLPGWGFKFESGVLSRELESIVGRLEFIVSRLGQVNFQRLNKFKDGEVFGVGTLHGLPFDPLPPDPVYYYFSTRDAFTGGKFIPFVRWSALY